MILEQRNTRTKDREALDRCWLSQSRTDGRLRFGFVLLLMFLTQACATGGAQGITIVRETVLSPGHAVDARSMMRTANGDVVVVGSTSDVGDPWPWASRIGADGKLKWEYLPAGPHDPFTYHDMIGQIFFNAVELEDGSILLCGNRKINGRNAVVLDRISDAGTLIDERVVKPEKPPVSPGDPLSVSCGRWGSGVAVTGAVSGYPAGRGWLIRLNEKGDVVWQKFADYYANGELVEAINNGLFTICWPHGEYAVAALDSQGGLIGLRKLENSDHPHLVYSGTPRSAAFVTVADVHHPFQTQIVEFNGTLSKMAHKGSIELAVNKAVELEDGSMVFVGSEKHGIPTASVVVLDKNYVESRLLVQPLNASPWFIDAVRGTRPNEIVAMRSTVSSEIPYPHGVLCWIRLNP